MTKFNTTSSSLFKNNNKEQIPNWMENVADNLKIKDHNVELEVEKRGVFAEKQQVYRPEVVADPRYLANSYDESKITVAAKTHLAKFLSGKYYKVVDVVAGTDFISLNVNLDSVPATFNFPFEVHNSKLTTASTFYVESSEYPFSKAGFEECLADIKNGTIKTATKAVGVDKVYVINREEIVRRFNGSLRQATDRINELLQEGSIIGASSNAYASFYDVDQLFPQMEKQAGEERMPEFHFAPNSEHVAPNESKSANTLSLEASTLLDNYFEDFTINASVRDGNELLVKATILGQTGTRRTVDFSFAVENEKLNGIKIAEIDNMRMTVEQLMNYLGSIDNSVLNKYLNNKKASNHIYSGVVLTRKDIKAKLFKIVEANKIDSVIDKWVYAGLITPVNSTTFATNLTFEELLTNTNIDTLSEEETKEIESYQKHFGEGLDLDTSLEKPEDKVREVEVDNEQLKLVNANNFISRHLKQYRVASFDKQDNDSYQLSIDFINTKTGTRHSVPFTVSFDNSKVLECTANINGKTIKIEKLIEAFAANKILSLYLQDKNANLTAGPIVISASNLKRKLSSIVTASKVDSLIQHWVSQGKLSQLDNQTLASEHSFEELLAMIDDKDIVTEEEQALATYQKQNSKELKVKTDDKVEDTGVREVEEKEWSSERKASYVAAELGKMFKDFEVVSNLENEDSFITQASVINPMSGAPIDLQFNFQIKEGKLGEITKVAHGADEVPLLNLVDLLRKYTSEASKQFAAHNKVSGRSYDVVISKTNLSNKLKSLTGLNKVASVIDELVSNKVLQPINSVTFASNHSVSEIVALVSDKLDVEAGKSQIELSLRDNHKISLNDNHIMDNDYRQLNSTVRELSPQMVEAKNGLVKAIEKAASSKKITAKKSELLLVSLENSKTAKDLELVAKELRNYLQ